MGFDEQDFRSSQRDVERHESAGSSNSLWYWTDDISVWRTMYNYLLVVLSRIAPSLRLKAWLWRRIGVSVGNNCSIGLEATPDVFYPERISIGDDVIIGYDVVLLCHEFLQDEYRLGDVRIEDGATIGARAIVLPGVTIGENATVGAGAVVTDDVEAGVTASGIPATSEE